MRLQVEILRHTLPPVNIVYNTSSGPSPTRTISELLAALDRVVPLESADGEWGLEDYVVEVAATSDQTNLYECLHYQLIKDVFKEDDEVIIRGLTTDEIRERRQGGRLQILPDGRHLFDGVAWGRRYNVNVHRPGITIPPRKRRRLLPPEEEEDVEQDKDILQLDYPAAGAQLGTVINDDYDEEEEDDDEEYEEYEDNSDGADEVDSEDDAEDELANPPLQIVARQEFEDADADSETGGSRSATSNEQETGLDAEEVQLLLKEAEEVEEAYHSLPLEFRVTSSPRKRKRTEHDVPTHEQDVTFEGFSSPTNGTKDSPASRKVLDRRVHGRIGDHMVVVPAKDAADASGPVGSNGSNGQLRNTDEVIQHQLNGPDHEEEALDNDKDSAESTSSSGDSDSESASENESSNESPDYDSDSDSDISSSDSESESDSETTSSSGESEDESGFETLAKKQPTSSAIATPPKIDGEHATISRVDNPPGSGTRRTRANNSRVKLRKRLSHLKEQGLLSPEADFEALKAYEANQQLPTNQEVEEDRSPAVSSELAQRKEEMLARLDSVYAHGAGQDIGEVQVEDSQPQSNEADAPEMAHAQDVPSSPAVEQQTSGEVPQKRTRLDVESSRRMLFNSLGVRNPKTPAAEQALREKLSKPVRNIQTKRPVQEEAKAVAVSDDNADSWKEKLIISAIECVQEGLLLSPPPFPFKQPWERGGIQKKKARLSEQYYQQENNDNDYAEEHDVNDAQPQPEMPKSLPDSRTISDGTADPDDIPIPTDFKIYPSLSQNDILVDTIIAYKELHITLKFEPEESPYRVARVVALNADSIDVVLSKRDQSRATTASFDEETGERIYNKFEMPMNDNYPEDDGLRELEFQNMIQPKLIQAAEVQVPNSDQNGGSTAADSQIHEESAVVPESAPAHSLADDVKQKPQIEVDTPRRNEITNIIRDAGFNSTLNEDLLQPIDMPKTHRAAALSATSSRASSNHSSEAKLQGKTQRKEPSNLWSSSPFESDDKNDTSHPKDQGGSSAQADVSSPPAVSMVETVDYLHVSQIDINQSDLTDHAASSSYQDAQRVSPDVSDNEHSGLSHLRIKQPIQLGQETSQVSLASEIPLSPANGLVTGSSDEPVDDELKDSSVRLRGGNVTEKLDSASESELDSDGLPSLRALTSSQRQHLSRSELSHHSLPQFLPQVSPPPIRQVRNNHEAVAQDVVHETESPELQIKISASQTLSLPLSQIPNDASIVDLTLSSDAVDPDDDGDDDQEALTAKRRAARQGKGKGNASQGNSQRAVTGRGVRSAFAGLGGKRNLSGKSRSRV